MRFLSFLCVMCLLFCGPRTVLGMTSTNYQIPWDSLNAGGDDVGTSTNYQVHSTVGETFAGVATSTNYQMQSGYRAGEDATALGLTVLAQSSGIEVSYSVITLPTAPYTVGVDSAAGFSVGDYIAVVENKGFSQLVVVGKIVGISGPIIEVDRWDGDTGSMSGGPTGGNDFVYKLGSATYAFGSLSAGTEHVSTVVSSVETSAASYTVYLNASNRLETTDGSYSMTPVTDGMVSSGSEEYGAEAIGSLAVQQGVDVGVTTTMRAIQTATLPSGNAADRIALLYKLSITSSTPAGTYGQNVYYTLTKNY